MRRPQTSSSSSTTKPKTGEVLDREPAAANGAVGDNYIALISQYTERPDLLIDALERHDPGFIKKMNEIAAARADRMSGAKFWFGGVQAYAGLFVSVAAAAVLLASIVFMVVNGKIEFWSVIALAVFSAVTQRGPSGFVELCKGIADYFRQPPNKKK